MFLLHGCANWISAGDSLFCVSWYISVFLELIVIPVMNHIYVNSYLYGRNLNGYNYSATKRSFLDSVCKQQGFWKMLS